MQMRKLSDEEVASIAAGRSGSKRVQDVVKAHEERKRAARRERQSADGNGVELSDEDLDVIAGGTLNPQLAKAIYDGAIYALYNEIPIEEALDSIGELEGRFSHEDVESMKQIFRDVYGA